MSIVNGAWQKDTPSIPKLSTAYLDAVRYTKLSRFDTTKFFKEGDEIRAEWTRNNARFWWKAKIIKVDARNKIKD